MTKKKTATIKLEKVLEATKKVSVPIGSLSQILAQRRDVQQKSFKPVIAVISVGGGGGNVLNNLINMGMDNVKTIACNTDAQSLEKSLANIKIQLGANLTHGHGAGALFEVGKLAAQESHDAIKKHLEGVHMAFIIACMGGGTGTGAAEVIAGIALDLGILTLGFATTPFDFEGIKRKKNANNGLEAFQANSDVLIVLGNQNLFSLANEQTAFVDAFKIADDVLCKAIQSVVRTISNSGLINTDLADFYTIMKGKHSRARMGTGIGEGEGKGLMAAQQAMANHLLELDGLITKEIDGIIICIVGGEDVTLNEMNEAVEYIRQSVADDANIIFGATIDPTMKNKMSLSLFATSSNQPRKTEVEYQLSEVQDKEKLSIDDFQELVIEDTTEIGAPHGKHMIHEENKNEEYVSAAKPGFFSRLLAFFGFGKKKDDLPTYLNKK
jgi:cell division protein FtsZ